MRIQVEPVGDVYAALLALAADECASFSLVWHAYTGDAVSALAADLLREERVRSWPGTALGGGAPATLRTYRMSARASAYLGEVGGLYAWRAPARPEDLALYAADGRVWLGSTAHEATAFFGEAAPPPSRLRAAVPGLFIR